MKNDHVKREYRTENDGIIQIVTKDAALLRLISYEAQDLSMVLLTASIPVEDKKAAVLILDLDTPDVMEWVAVGNLPSAKIIGICWAKDKIPHTVTDHLQALLQRPFLMSELRSQLRETEDTVCKKSNTTEEAKIDIRLEGDILSIDGEKIKLTKKETILMQLLLENRGNVVRREKIDEVIGITQDRKSGVTNKTEVYLCFLRRKLEKPTGKHIITTIRGIGYRLDL